MAMVIDPKQRQRMQWGAAAEAWDRRFDWYSAAFRPLMEWCCEAAGVSAGSRILDVACGSGQPSFTAAARVGPAGRVVGIDLSPEMLAACRRRAERLGHDHLEFHEMDAEQLRFDDESFDAITCSCGLMFFPDAEKALAEMRRVLKPHGRLALAVWDDPSNSPFLTIGGGSVARFFPPAPPDPKAPGGFRLSQPGTLEALLHRAGFHSCIVESVRMPIVMTSTAEYWDVFTDMAAGIKDKIAALSAEDRERLRRTVEDAAQPYVEDGRLHLAATPLCAAATK